MNTQLIQPKKGYHSKRMKTKGERRRTRWRRKMRRDDSKNHKRIYAFFLGAALLGADSGWAVVFVTRPDLVVEMILGFSMMAGA